MGSLVGLISEGCAETTHKQLRLTLERGSNDGGPCEWEISLGTGKHFLLGVKLEGTPLDFSPCAVECSQHCSDIGSQAFFFKEKT